MTASTFPTTSAETIGSIQAIAPCFVADLDTLFADIRNPPVVPDDAGGLTRLLSDIAIDGSERQNRFRRDLPGKNGRGKANGRDKGKRSKTPRSERSSKSKSSDKSEKSVSPETPPRPVSPHSSERGPRCDKSPIKDFLRGLERNELSRDQWFKFKHILRDRKQEIKDEYGDDWECDSFE